MNNTENIILSQVDFEKLSALVKNVHTDAAALLEEELNRADIVNEEELPKDVVAMNSSVSFQDMDTGKESSATLVYPNEANLEENKLSILAPVGAALIGLRVGQVIRWPMPNGKEKKLKVTSVKN